MFKRLPYILTMLSFVMIKIPRTYSAHSSIYTNVNVAKTPFTWLHAYDLGWVDMTNNTYRLTCMLMIMEHLGVRMSQHDKPEVFINYAYSYLLPSSSKWHAGSKIIGRTKYLSLSIVIFPPQLNLSPLNKVLRRPLVWVSPHLSYAI